MLFVTPSAMAGNTWNDSFNRSKKLLEKQVYFDHKLTFYCNATFDDFRNISRPDGCIAKSHEKRAEKFEWEHIHKGLLVNAPYALDSANIKGILATTVESISRKAHYFTSISPLAPPALPGGLED